MWALLGHRDRQDPQDQWAHPESQVRQELVSQEGQVCQVSQESQVAQVLMVPQVSQDPWALRVTLVPQVLVSQVNQVRMEPQACLAQSAPRVIRELQAQLVPPAQLDTASQVLQE